MLRRTRFSALRLVGQNNRSVTTRTLSSCCCQLPSCPSFNAHDVGIARSKVATFTRGFVTAHNRLNTASISYHAITGNSGSERAQRPAVGADCAAVENALRGDWSDTVWTKCCVHTVGRFLRAVHSAHAASTTCPIGPIAAILVTCSQSAA